MKNNLIKTAIGSAWLYVAIFLITRFYGGWQGLIGPAMLGFWYALMFGGKES